MTKRAEEHMSKIAGDFCNWLRDLPGEDRAINSLSETQLRVSIQRFIFSFLHVEHGCDFSRPCLTQPSPLTLGPQNWRRA